MVTFVVTDILRKDKGVIMETTQSSVCVVSSSAVFPFNDEIFPLSPVCFSADVSPGRHREGDVSQVSFVLFRI